MPKKSIRPLFIGLFILFLIALPLYTFRDNQRFMVVRQSVIIKGLASEFDGYSILQISDLHGQYFGEHQKDIAAVIQRENVDLVAVTGDVQDRNSRELLPFYEVLRVIKPGIPVVCVEGNGDPPIVSLKTGAITAVGREWQQNGCALLHQPFVVQRGDAQLWFSELFDGDRRESRRHSNTLEDRVQIDAGKGNFVDSVNLYQQEISKLFASIPPETTLIGITHYPVTRDVLDDPEHDGMLPFRLVLAGHYHGGQFRLPFLGALFIPIPSNPAEGFFPDPQIVSGLYQGDGMQQYISRGLGAGGPVPVLTFRLFNTPEVNLITLRATAD